MRNPGDAYYLVAGKHDGYRTPATHFSQIH